MRKLLYLLFAITFVIASCEPVSPEPEPEPQPEEQPEEKPEEQPEDKPEDKPEQKQPVLTLTSDAIVEFGVEGGNADVTYTLENPVEGVNVLAECRADWVEYRVFAAENKISLVVAANDGEARETTLVARYSTETFEVVIKQEAKPFDGYVLSYMSGTHYAPGYWEHTPDNHNYYLALSDVDNFATYASNAAYLEIDLWAATEGVDGAVPAGEYLLDVNDSGAPGTIGCSYTRFLEMNADQVPVVWILPIEGKVIVSDSGLEGYLRDEYGEVTFRYAGSLVVPTEEKK